MNAVRRGGEGPEAPVEDLRVTEEEGETRYDRDD
jgi:hypothetical protein